MPIAVVIGCCRQGGSRLFCHALNGAYFKNKQDGMIFSSDVQNLTFFWDTHAPRR
jgi:hypothetical protein